MVHHENAEVNLVLRDITDGTKLTEDFRRTRYHQLDYDIRAMRSSAGGLILWYQTDIHELEIGNIWLMRNLQNNGSRIGRAVYEKIPLLDDIEDAHNYRFVSGVLNDASRAVWRGLVRDGLAQQLEGLDSYEMIKKPVFDDNKQR